MKTNEEKEIVFEIGGEGGSIAIYCERDKNGVKFIYNHNEIDFSDEGLSINKSDVYEDFESAFQIINERYSWHFLYLLTVDDAYKDYVANELINKLNQQKVLEDDFQSRSNFEKVLAAKFEFDNGRNIWKKSINIDKIVSYLREVILKASIEKRYKWQFKLDENSSIPIELNDYQKCIWLRENLKDKIHALYKNDSVEFKKQYQWIISKWGGIRLGDVEKLDNLVTDFINNKDLCTNKNFDRISSVSKVATFMFPQEYIIYDSRVAFAMNWILVSQGLTNRFFPIPEGRNSKMLNFDVNVIINLMFKGDISVLIPKNEAYNKMNDLITKINNKLWDTDEERKNIYLTEMLLFSIADTYIIDNWAEIKSGIVDGWTDGQKDA
ncbi:MAG: hypothetical protein WCG93_15560 [Paludibacter sp.]